MRIAPAASSRQTGGRSRSTACAHWLAVPTDSCVALGLASGSIELRDVTTGALLESFGGDGVAVAALTFARPPDVIVAAWDDGRVATITLQAPRL